MWEARGRGALAHAGPSCQLRLLELGASIPHNSVTLLLLRQFCPRREKYQQPPLSVWYNLELSHSHQSQNQWPSHSCQGAMCQPQTPAPSFPCPPLGLTTPQGSLPS